MTMSNSVLLKAAVIMVLVQSSFAWINVFYKLAQSDGMILRVIVAYRFIFACCYLVPVSLIFEREAKHMINKVTIFQAFLCALSGVLFHNLYIESLDFTTCTFASAMMNLAPGTTFVLSALLRMEKVGLVKVAGVVTAIGGAMTITFFKGFALNISQTHINLLKDASKNAVVSHHSNSILGAAFGFASCMSFSSWLIIQAKMLKKFPYPNTATALTTILGAVLSSGFALCFDRKPREWALGLNIRLATAAYGGIVVSGVSFSLMTWCLQLSSPLFVSAFYPIMLIVAAFSGTLFLGERLFIGSVLGSLLVIIGLYLVLWGKSKDKMLSVESKNATSVHIMESKNATSVHIMESDGCHIQCKRNESSP